MFINATNHVNERGASFAAKQRGMFGAWFDSWRPNGWSRWVSTSVIGPWTGVDQSPQSLLNLKPEFGFSVWKDVVQSEHR